MSSLPNSATAIDPIQLAAGQVWHLSAPITHHVKTSFGTMTARTGVLVVLSDDAGNRGWGESWVNFPTWGSWERTKAFEQAYLPYLQGKRVESIPDFVRKMYLAFRGMAVQAATMGPLEQAMCAVELGLWDLAGRRAGRPLRKLWSNSAADMVTVYGSGINAPLPLDQINPLLDAGVSVFKLKLGFGEDNDRQNLKDLARHLGTKARIATDVNRGWDLATAKRWLPVLRDFDVQWLEEPLRPDQEHLMSELADGSPVPIAGGENVFFDPASADVSRPSQLPLDIFQPDITKNCLPSQALALMPLVQARGRKLYPHFLGSAPGQAASIQLAACCGDTLMEWDLNENPLRTNLMTRPFKIENGRIHLDDAPGIGYDPDPAALARYRVK